ncbi:MAG: hypothetical protein ABF739_12245 [Acetobacter okinawensis]|uniref:helix-turn-helix domain-containing protein n=1 Tax=Acetobacter okinawensis TaxID=1076594 RepID=UPI0039EBCB9F
MFKVLETYEEDGLGLPYAVTLVNAAEVEIDDDTGEVLGVSVPDMEGLAAAVAMARALLPAGLLPEEVKFFRTVLDLKSKDMADVLTMDPATYSRWENGKQGVGQWADKQMRFAVVTELRDRFPHFSVDPKSVVSLKPKKARPGQKPPVLCMVRMPLPTILTSEDESEWDTMQAA